MRRTRETEKVERVVRRTPSIHEEHELLRRRLWVLLHNLCVASEDRTEQPTGARAVSWYAFVNASIPRFRKTSAYPTIPLGEASFAATAPEFLVAANSEMPPA